LSKSSTVVYLGIPNFIARGLLMPKISTPVRRGTTNRNARGSSTDRRRRREWLIRTYGKRGKARCWRGCGTWLTVETVTVGRIIPGCQGGTYRRDNIMPECGPCNSSFGGAERRAG
jgi:hypothetical protein